MAPPLSAVRNAIVAKMQAVPNIGVVHAYERYANEQAQLQALYGTPHLEGWFIRRRRSPETSPALGRYVETTFWQFRGYKALADAEQSELVFDDRIEAIRDAFRADETLGGVVATTVIEGSAGIQVEESGPVLFAGVLCHAATLALATRRYL